MIQINLLPLELKVKAKEKREPAFTFDNSYVVYIIPAVLVICVIMHLYTGMMFTGKKRQLAQVKKEWTDLEASRKSLEETKKKHTTISEDTAARDRVTAKRVLWSGKIKAFEGSVPDGMWLTDLLISSKDLSLQGSVVSRQGDEMTIIKDFMDKLGREKTFISDFSSFELSSVKKRVVGSLEIADFVMSGTVKTE